MALLLGAILLSASGAGCSSGSHAGSGPGTPRAAIASLREAAAERDWGAFETRADVTAVADSFTQAAFERSGMMAGAGTGTDTVIADTSERGWYNYSEQFALRLREYVEEGPRVPGRGFPGLLDEHLVTHISEDDESVIVRLVDESHDPSTLEIRMVSVEDCWMMVEIVNAQEILASGHLFD